jgi:hypothetical protein
MLIEILLLIFLTTLKIYIMNNVDQARKKYYPEEVKFIFIAEAPPCKEGHFFYFEDVPKGDSLFLHIIRAVFPDLEEWETKKIRKHKAELLERFKNAGYLLEDSVAIAIEKGTSARNKEKIIEANQSDLVERLKEYKEDIPVVLLSAGVFKINYEFMKAQGFTVLNDFPIPFPGSGQQGKFKEAIARIEVAMK